MTNIANWQNICGKFLDAWLGHRAEQRIIPGFSVAILYDNEVFYNRAFGYADMLAQERLSSAHQFNIGSQAKMLTAVLVLQLVAEGTLSLDDEAGKYIPWLSECIDQRIPYITVDQLLTHWSGLPRDGKDADFWQLKRDFPGEKELQHMICSSALIFPPGCRIKYSNLGYALLGQIVENATGQKYAKLADKRIIKPLKLSNTCCAGSPIVSAASGYTTHIEGRRKSLNLNCDVGAYTGVCGWLSTPRDMLMIVTELQNCGHVISPQAKSLLLSNGRSHWRPSCLRRCQYGRGIMIQEMDGRLLVGHTGSFVAHKTCFYLDPKEKIAVSLMANSADASVTEMAVGILTTVQMLHDWFGKQKANKLHAKDCVPEGVFENLLCSKYIFNNGTKKMSASLDSWSPLEDCEYLERQSTGNFRFTERADYLLAPGEEIFCLQGSRSVQQINYAGLTMRHRRN